MPPSTRGTDPLHAVRAHGADRLGQQPQERRGQHGAGGEADQVRQEPGAARLREAQEQHRQRGAEQAAEQRGENNPEPESAWPSL